MKKILAVLLSSILVIGPTACSNSNASTLNYSDDLTVSEIDNISSSVSDFDFAKNSTELSDYEDITGQYDKFNCPASENGLGESPVLVYGKVTNLRPYDENMGMIDLLTDEGTWLLNFPLAPTELLERFDGEMIAVCGTYPGFSGVQNLPMIHGEYLIFEQQIIWWLDEELNYTYGMDYSEIQQKIEEQEEKNSADKEQRKNDAKNDRIQSKGEDYVAAYNELVPICSDTVNNFDFDSLSAALSSYDKPSNPYVESLVGDISDIIKPALQYSDFCTVEYDKVEKTSSVTFGGLTDISSDICFVPRIDGRTRYYRIGFKASDWLFFDRIIMSPVEGDNHDMKFKSYDLTRDVVSGGVIEYIDDSFVDLVDITNGGNATIRFKNSDSNNYLDFELSDTETKAIIAASVYSETSKNLSNYIFNLDE